jgi:hypothetical protein
MGEPSMGAGGIVCLFMIPPQANRMRGLR